MAALSDSVLLSRTVAWIGGVSGVISLAVACSGAGSDEPDAGKSSTGGAISSTGGTRTNGGTDTGGTDTGGTDTGGTTTGGASAHAGATTGGTTTGGSSADAGADSGGPAAGGAGGMGGSADGGTGGGGAGGPGTYSYPLCDPDLGQEDNPACDPGTICRNGYCAAACENDLVENQIGTGEDCPRPATGNPEISCALGYCVMNCLNGETCPDGMVCKGPAPQPNDEMCWWPE
jgi:hypothetical protein